jgi:transmembrane sensor
MENGNEKLPFNFTNKEVPAGLQQQNWEAIQRGIAHSERLVGKRSQKTWLAIAGVFTLVVVMLGLWFVSHRQQSTPINHIATNYGELKTIRLRDSSIIVLNGHSSIHIHAQWKQNEPREIWLEGEAFFDIKHLNKDTFHIQPEERFLVHCTDVTVEVLGTSFDIRQRRGKTEVVLQTGSISIHLNSQPQLKRLMRPGAIFTYNKQENQLKQDTTEPANYTAWKEKKLLLNNPTVEEVLYYLEDNYGKKIILNSAEKRKVRIEGPILLTNLDDALFIVSTVLKANIEKSDSAIVITPR